MDELTFIRKAENIYHQCYVLRQLSERDKENGRDMRIISMRKIQRSYRTLSL